MGPRLATLIQRAANEHLYRTQGHRARIGAQAANVFFRGVNAEIAATTAPAYRELAELEELPDWLRETFAFLARTPGEWSALVSTLGVGSAVSTGLGSALSNYMAPWVQNMLASAPHGILSPATAADLTAREWWPIDEAAHEARRSGLSPHRFQGLVHLARQYPAVEQLLVMANRGLIGQGEFRAAAQRQGLPSDWHDHLWALRHVLIPPASLADMVQRGIIGHGDAQHTANRQGVSDADFDHLVHQAGEPPGLQDLLFAYRRGIIDRHRLEHGIRQSRVRNEWIDVVESLRHVPMSTMDAIRAAVQNHLSKDRAKGIAEDN